MYLAGSRVEFFHLLVPAIHQAFAECYYLTLDISSKFGPLIQKGHTSGRKDGTAFVYISKVVQGNSLDRCGGIDCIIGLLSVGCY